MNDIRKIIAPKNAMLLFKWLFEGKLKPNSLWESKVFRLKFALRAVFASPITFRWLKHLANYRLMGYFLFRQSNLPCKLLRPYLTSCMNQVSRYHALVYHYDFLSSLKDTFTQAFYNNKPYLLADLTVKNEHNIRVMIQAKNKYAREGELTIFIFDENNVDLATLTFTIIQYEQKSTLFISGLQGPDRDDAKTAIQQATKNCYGIFPKRLIIDAALSIAEFFNLEQILAVGKKSHVYNNWRYKKRFNRVHADYDEFWQTIDGQPNKQGLFILPAKISRKNIEEVASKKRSMYRSRYSLLDELNLSILKQLSCLN